MTKTLKVRKIGKGIKTSHAKAKPSKAVPYIMIERPVHHIGKGGSFYRTRFNDLDGNAKFADIPRKSFSIPTEAIALLLNEHAKLPTTRKDQKACIEDAIVAMGNKPTLNITDRVGWSNSGGNGSSFVYYGKTYGAERDTLQLDDDNLRNPALGKKAGTVEGWRDGLEEPCRFSDHLVLAVGITASGPLYGIIGSPEPAIYHFQGARKPAGDTRAHKSSSGKTLCARAGQSAFGACSRTDLFGFNMTSLALEETCFSCNNLVVVLDEEGAAGEGGESHTINPKVLPYRIVGGQGKKRSRNYTSSQGLSNRSWVVPVITTAEDELDSGSLVRKEGAQVRMVAIPFPATWEGGTFRTVASPTERNRLAQRVETTIAANYGVMMPTFIGHLVKDSSALSLEIPKLRDKFVREVGAANNIWEKRYAEKFAMVLVAALLMVRYDIAPWTEKRAITAVTNLYKSSRSMMVSVPDATDALLNKLHKLVGDKSRFPRVPKGKALTSTQKSEMCGLVRDIGGKKNVTALTLSRFEKLVKPSAAATEVLEALAQQGRLVKDADGDTLTRQVKISGLTDKRARYVCIKGLVARPA